VTGGAGGGTTFEIRIEAERYAPSLRIDVEDAASFLAIDVDRAGAATKLVELLAGFVRPERGLIRIGGETLVDTARGHFTPPSRRAVGFIPAGVELFPHLTVEENLAVGIARLTAALADRFQGVVQTFALAPLLRLRPNELRPREVLFGAVARALTAPSRWLLLERPDEALIAGGDDGVIDLLERIAEFDVPCILTCRGDTRLPKRIGTRSLARYTLAP
jgi:molybdate transport system ATP-binding protein